MRQELGGPCLLGNREVGLVLSVSSSEDKDSLAVAKEVVLEDADGKRWLCPSRFLGRETMRGGVMSGVSGFTPFEGVMVFCGSR